MSDKKKQLFLKIILIFIIIGLDLVTKDLFFGDTKTIIPNIIGIRDSSLNTGGAWSILSGETWLLVLLTFVFLIFAFIFDALFETKSKLYFVAFSFIIGGTIGNLIDRLVLGGVRDFLYFEFYQMFPTFNVADSFLCIGMFLFALFVLFGHSFNKDEK